MKKWSRGWETGPGNPRQPATKVLTTARKQQKREHAEVRKAYLHPPHCKSSGKKKRKKEKPTNFPEKGAQGQHVGKNPKQNDYKKEEYGAI